jgi:hypothetical protein
MRESDGIIVHQGAFIAIGSEIVCEAKPHRCNVTFPGIDAAGPGGFLGITRATFPHGGT